MLVPGCQRMNTRDPSATGREHTRRLQQSNAPAEFLQLLEKYAVPLKAIRLILPAVDEVSTPAAHCSPQFTRKLARRFLSHLEFAITSAVDWHYTDRLCTRRLAWELRDIVHALHAPGQARIDRLLVPDLQQLSVSLEAIAGNRRR